MCNKILMTISSYDSGCKKTKHLNIICFDQSVGATNFRQSFAVLNVQTNEIIFIILRVEDDIDTIGTKTEMYWTAYWTRVCVFRVAKGLKKTCAPLCEELIRLSRK